MTRWVTSTPTRTWTPRTTTPATTTTHTTVATTTTHTTLGTTTQRPDPSRTRPSRRRLCTAHGPAPEPTPPWSELLPHFWEMYRVIETIGSHSERQDSATQPTTKPVSCNSSTCMLYVSKVHSRFIGGHTVDVLSNSVIQYVWMLIQFNKSFAKHNTNKSNFLLYLFKINFILL